MSNSAFGASNPDHGNLAGLTDDDHAQYALLLGRDGGQVLAGGPAASSNLTLKATTSSTDGDVIFMSDNTTERMRIDNAGAVSIGATPKTIVYGGTSYKSQVQNWGTDTATSIVALATNATADQPIITLLRSRNATPGLHTIVQVNDVLGALQWYGSDGTDYAPAASVDVIVDGTPGNNDMPGAILFKTTADGAASLTERFRINNAGALGIGGANFGTDQYHLISGGSAAQPAWGQNVTSITSSRDLATASGNVSYTGVGFKPKAVIQVGGVSGSPSSSMGFAASGGGGNQEYSGFFNGNLGTFQPVAGNYQVATMLSFDSDGFTITWTKSGLPTGTCSLAFLCIR